MKIGIVTYFDINNYGSVLQAYAMRSILASMGDEAVFLRIKEKNKLIKYVHMLHVGAVTGSKCLFDRTALETHKEIRRLKSMNDSGISLECKHEFSKFVKKNLPTLTIGRLSLKKRAADGEFGAFICGSDQIWSPLSVHMSSHKFLCFAPREKRIAYAPSFGVESIPSYNRRFIKKAISGIDDISVRELSGAIMINELTGKDVPILLDPTLLISGETWREKYVEQVGELGDNGYALCYFFDEPDERTLDSIATFTKKRGLRIITLSVGNKGLISRGAEYVAADPWRFLSLIDNASYVFTNSFHGSAFSILFEKRFVVFGRNHSNAVKQTSRISALLEIVDADECFYVNDGTSFAFPNPNGFYAKLEKEQEYSLIYLKTCLDKRR